jgi:tetratricopeptide (TPR) repeat protein
MPPEQAAGNSRVDGRADVYALGAILYECLTGRPPFRGATLTETLQQVREAEVVPPSQLIQRLPRDLETICLKCLRKEAERRYQTAQELADDLGRYLRGEAIHARPVNSLERMWRWCRRRPVQASLTAALILVTVGGVLGIWSQWRLAEQRRVDAEQRFTLALETNLSVGELAEKLRPLAGTQTPTVEKILQLAEQNYEKFLIEVGPSPAVNAGKARMLTAFSDLYWLMNRSRQAQETARQAIGLWEELRRDEPTNNRHREGLALAQARLSNAYYSQGRTTDAADAARASLALRRELLAEMPDDSERQTGVVIGLMTLVRVLTEQDDRDGAAPLRREADERIDAMAKTGRHSPRWRFAYVRLRRTHGDDLYHHYRFPEALALYRQLSKECAEWAGEDRDDTDLQAELVETESSIAWTLQGMGHAAEARGAFGTALRRAEEFERRDPNNLTWKQAVIRYRLKEADVVEDTASLSRARIVDSLREHLHLLVELHRLVAGQSNDDPGNRRHHLNRAELLIEQAMTRAALALLGDDRQSRGEQALDNLKDARGRLDKLVDHDPLNHHWARQRLRVPNVCSLVLRVLGKRNEAIKQQIESAKLQVRWCEEHLQRKPDSRRRRSDAADAHALLGMRWCKLGDANPSESDAYRHGLASLRQAHAAYARLVKEDSENLFALHQLIRVSEMTGSICRQVGETVPPEVWPEAVGALREKRQRLLEKQPPPDSPTYPECSIIQLAQRLVGNVEAIDAERDMLDLAEQEFKRTPGALNAVQVLRHCRDLARQLAGTPSSDCREELRRVAERGLSMLAVIEREGKPGESVKKALAELAELRKRAAAP